ncbi:hypothetical protein AAF712_002585 [Marasmius tenuissimus]|uniref:GPR1/FUN34/YaaH-class plasma membrane protein n=1 Tax=Marasmius tenuissimus TaxID=585030 RepID=A0ABR3AAR9_9AGAR|nr:hypothetical protein PM082_005836 [Marasmius tenuissimus]
MASPINSKGDIEQGVHIENANPQVPDGPIMLSREQYARLFLEPGGRAPTVQKFANPTPFCVICFLLSLAPTSCILLAWGEADTSSLVSIVGPFYFIGGLGMIIGGAMEWILGNTFPFVVFSTFGGFWLALGVTQDPMHAVSSAFTATGGLASPALNSGLMFYFAFWGAICFIYFIASLRTHCVFAFILGTLVFGFACLSAGYGRLAKGDADAALDLIKAAGGFTFATSLAGFYLAFALIFGCVGMPIELPLGDLSGRLFKNKKTN